MSERNVERKNATQSYSVLASYFWTASIAIYFYIRVVRREPLNYVIMGRVFHAVCWGVPGAIIILGLWENIFGDDMTLATGPWCWIDGTLPRTEQIAWMVGTMMFWELFVYLLTVGLFIVLKYEVWCLHKKGRTVTKTAHITGDSLREDDENFLWVPLVMILSRSWGTAREIIALVILGTAPGTFVVPTMLDVSFLYLQCFGNNGQAFFNSLLFCLCDREVRTKACSCSRLGYENFDDQKSQTTVQTAEPDPWIVSYLANPPKYSTVIDSGDVLMVMDPTTTTSTTTTSLTLTPTTTTSTNTTSIVTCT